MQFSLIRITTRRRAAAHGAKQRGVTLIELMVALTIFALLLGIAVPSFRGFVAANRLSSTAQDFLASLQLARSEAMKRGAQISLSHSATPGSGNWGSGWTMFVDTNGNGALDVGEQVLRDGAALTAPLTLLASANFGTFIAFNRDGRLTNAGGGVFVLCQGTALLEDGQSRARAVLVNGAGRVRMARDSNGDGIPETDTGPVASCTP